MTVSFYWVEVGTAHKDRVTWAMPLADALRVCHDPGHHGQRAWKVEVYATTEAVVRWLAGMSTYDVERATENPVAPPEGIRVRELVFLKSEGDPADG